MSIKTKNFIFWPDKNTISATLPASFKLNYPNCRCIIDCTEIKTEQPNTVEQRVHNMYSRNKSCYTIKILVAITPNGMITISFVSKCYGGRISDSFITNDSGFLSKLELGDIVFTEDEVMETYTAVASVRIHIERVFSRLKTHGILNKISMDLMPVIDEIIHICCV